MSLANKLLRVLAAEWLSYSLSFLTTFYQLLIIIQYTFFTCPLTAGVPTYLAGALSPVKPRGSLVHHRWHHNQFPPFCVCSPLPSGTWRTPGLSIPWCCLPTSSSVCLVFLLSLCLAWWFWARPNVRETCPYHCSLRLFSMVRRSSCGPIACWILAKTSLLVAWSLY